MTLAGHVGSGADRPAVGASAMARERHLKYHMIYCLDTCARTPAEGDAPRRYCEMALLRSGLFVVILVSNVQAG